MKRFGLDIAPMAGAMALAVLTAAVSAHPAVAADLPLITKAAPVAADPNRFWAEMEYLAWNVKGDRLPALVTTSPAGTPLATAGVLGAPGTTVLFGDSSVNDRWRSGGRLSGGYWFDPTHRTGIEASFFGLERASTDFSASSTGTPILARPFFDVINNAQNAALIAFPGLAAGSVTARETSSLYGAGALYRQEIASPASSFGMQRLSLLAGYRYLHAGDRLDISTTSVFGGPLFVGTVGVSDSFHASSNFHGLDLGLTGEFTNGPWMLEWRAKVALGANINDAQINGATAITAGGATANVTGGLLALGSNIGSYSQTRFAAVPDLALKARYQFAPGWQAVVGYEVLYWTGVQRAGGLIDSTVNTNLIPPVGGGGPQRPQATFATSSLLAQGFSFGVRHPF